MLEVYHHGSSVCAAKVRVVLFEKEIEWTSRYVDLLAGEQFNRGFLKMARECQTVSEAPCARRSTRSIVPPCTSTENSTTM